MPESIPPERDFGGMVTKRPREIHQPSTISELAKILGYYNRKSVPVVIRNTGHSVNGQTITDGVQIQLGLLNRVDFDEENLIVTAEAGCSWDKLMKAIRLPEYCTDVFPNNPGQEIHVGGTAAVGGWGFFSTKYGCFWNCVEALTLVTMTGQIIDCSRTKHSDYFYFALGGFGRIGVIVKLSIRVKKTTNKLLGIGLFYHSTKTLLSDVKKAFGDHRFNSVMLAHHVLPTPRFLDGVVKAHVMGLVIEIDINTDAVALMRSIRKEFREDLAAYTDFDVESDGLFHLRNSQQPHREFTLEELVYWYPDRGKHGPGIANPWSDYCILPEHYENFLGEAERIIEKYDLRQYLPLQKVDNFFDYHLDGAYVIDISTNDTPWFGNTPGWRDANYMFSYGLMPTVPVSKSKEVIEAIKELTDITYKLGGRRYLYGVHSLSKRQVVQQFGLNSIKRWERLKNVTDPKRLLNPGVIPYLD